MPGPFISKDITDSVSFVAAGSLPDLMREAATWLDEQGYGPPKNHVVVHSIETHYNADYAEWSIILHVSYSK
jgi:hypothetical protein